MLGIMSENGKYGKYEMTGHTCIPTNVWTGYAPESVPSTFGVCQPLNSDFFKIFF